MEHLIELLSDSLAELALAVLLGLAGWVARAVHRWLGVDASARLAELEARHRADLHAAIERRIALALTEHLSPAEIPDWIEDRVRTAMPKTIAALDPLPGALGDLIRAKLADMER